MIKNKLTIFPSNNTSWIIRLLAEKYNSEKETAIALLFGIGGWRGVPEPVMPYALDNGAWPAYKNGEPWDEYGFLKLVERAAACPKKPMFLIVPDAVGNASYTLESWHRWQPELKNLGWPLAFAVQDGIKPEQVPPEADLIFVGGTTQWKLKTMRYWCERYSCHVGQINTGKRLYQCHDAGAQSVDGTGWLRDRRSLCDLIVYLEIAYGHAIEYKQLELFQNATAYSQV